MQDNRFDFLEIDVGPPPASPPPEPEGEPVPAIMHGPARPEGEPLPERWRVTGRLGEQGGYSGQFACPGGAAVDRHGRLFVADSYNHRIQRLGADGGAV